MSGESGRFLTINNVGSVMSATINESRTPESYVASNTAGGTSRGGGVSDWSASLAGKGGFPPVFPNDQFALQVYSYPDNGIEGGDGLRYIGDCICSQIAITWNHVNNQLTSWTAELASRSSLTTDTGAPFPDATPVSQDYPCGTFPTADGVEIPAITTSTLTITANLSEANNSSTRDAAGCFIQRNPGPIDWTWSATQEDYRRGLAGYPALGDRMILNLPINDTQAWDLKWGQQIDYTSLTFNTDGTNITRQLNVGMVANDGTGIGSINQPDGTLKWGV